MGCVPISSEVKTTVVRTAVRFKRLTEEEIDAYIATGDSMDKAGAYGIQGRAAAFIEGIEGCYSNVVGLPLSELADILKAISLTSSSACQGSAGQRR